MSFLEDQIGMLKNAIENGIISKDSPLIQEQKELIIDMMYNMSKFRISLCPLPCVNGIEFQR